MHRLTPLILVVAVVTTQTGCRSNATAPAAPQTKVSPDESVTLYRVQPGDSPWTIAEKFYGDGSKVHWILNANPGIDPTKLQLGEIIRVPKLPNNDDDPRS